MKNLLLISFVTFSAFFSTAQLMRSEVYDFSIGNYYGMRFEANNPGSTSMMTVRYQMFHILSKQLSVTNDTVEYVAQRQTYIPQLPNGSGGSTPSSYSMDTISFTHIALNSSYEPSIFDMPFGNSTTYFWDADTNECYHPMDTLYPSPWCINNSGQANRFGMFINNMDSCSLEPLISEYHAYSHAGGPYGGRTCPGDPTYPNMVNELFYVVHNGVECGQFPSFFLKTEELESLNLSVYPNPATNQLNIAGVEEIKNFTVFSSQGKSVTSQISWNELSLDVSLLPAGIYFLKLTDVTGKTGMVKFAK